VTFLEADFDEAATQASTIDNTQLYTGRERDAETGLQINRNRIYGWNIARWLTHDPIEYVGGYNLYEYVGGMATSFTDPLGFWNPRPNPPQPFDPDDPNPFAPPPNQLQRCEKLLETIENIRKDIQKRIEELMDDPLGLPGTTPNDHNRPGESRRGHERIINELKKTLDELINEYKSKCVPDPKPEECPEPNPSPRTNPYPIIPIIVSPAPEQVPGTPPMRPVGGGGGYGGGGGGGRAWPWARIGPIKHP
jgi:RHS repeat-associated protein